MLVDIKQFWLDDTNDETILEQDLNDAYNYSIKHYCVVIIYFYNAGPMPAIFIRDNSFSINKQITYLNVTNVIKSIISKIKGNKKPQYNWFD